MKASTVLFRGAAATLSLLLLSLAACGPQEAADTTSEPVTEITITGDDLMRFSTNAFTVPAGEEITLEFANVGRMPKESMGHNIVILERGTDLNMFATASTRFPQHHYIAPDYQDRVIAYTPILGPGESHTVTFTAPTTPGEYPFSCPFPGHTQAGMRGIMTVQ